MMTRTIERNASPDMPDPNTKTGINDTNIRRSSIKAILQSKWMVLICACGVIIIHGGYFLSLGAIFVDLLEALEESRAETAAIQSVYVAVHLSSGFFVGFAVDRFGTRTCGVVGCFVTTIATGSCYFAQSTIFLIIIIGAVAGAFSSLFVISGIKAVSLAFEGSTKMVVLSLFYASGPIAGIGYPYLLRYLSDTYGIHWSFLIIGFIMIPSVLMALTWSVQKQEPKHGSANSHADSTTTANFNKDQVTEAQKYLEVSDPRYCSNVLSELEMPPDEKSDHELKEIVEKRVTCKENKRSWRNILKTLLCNIPFVLFVIGMALTHSSFRVLSVFITDILKERGFTPSEATIALMVFNFSGIPGCLLPGLVKKLPMGSSLCCVALVTFLASPSTLALNFVTGLAIAVVCCAAVGLAFGAVTAANAVSVAGLVGEECYAPGVGLSYGLTGIIVAGTGPLSGSLRDSSSSYLMALIILAAAVLLGSAMFFLSFMLKRRKKRQKSKHSVRETKGSVDAPSDSLNVFTISTRL